MGCAQTGTGKTAAFALPMLDRLSAAAPRKKGAVRALILTPTRELALQIGESFDAYGKYLKLRSTVIFGGVGQAPQVEAIRKGVDILIACPGRLNDLIGQGHIDLSNLEIFVLDEADRMLDMGFVHDVKKVIAKLPAKRQNLMFSATMPKEIEQLAAGILHDPAFVKVDPVSSTVERIDQSLYFVEKGNKKLLLPWLIKNPTPPVQNALVFSRTKHGADKIARDPDQAGHHRRCDPRQQEPDRPCGGAGRLQGGQDQGAGGHGHRRPRHRHQRALPCVQLRPARGAGDLRPPYRPHRPRGRRRHGGELLRTRRDGISGRHRKAQPPEDPGGVRPPVGRRTRPVKAAPPVRGRKPKAEQPAPEKAETPKAEKAARPAAPEKKSAARPSAAKSRRPPKSKQKRNDSWMITSAPPADATTAAVTITTAPAARAMPPHRGAGRGSNAQPKFDPHFVSAPEATPLRSAKKNAATPAAPAQTIPTAMQNRQPAQRSENNGRNGAGRSPRNERNDRGARPAQPAQQNSQRNENRSGRSSNRNEQSGAGRAPRAPRQSSPAAITAAAAIVSRRRTKTRASCSSAAARRSRSSPALRSI